METLQKTEPKIVETQEITSLMELVTQGADLAIVRNVGVDLDALNQDLDQLPYDNAGSDSSWAIKRYAKGGIPIPQELHDACANAGYRIINTIVNDYQPGDSMPKHTDLSNYSEPDNDPNQHITFIYVASGSKKLRMYFDGEDGPYTDITQSPDMLMAFRGGSILLDGKQLEAICHEVVPQDTNCRTLTFGLMSLTR